MAKGQKKSNREVRKPKATKSAGGQTPAPLFANGTLTPGAVAKKKG